MKLVYPAVFTPYEDGTGGYVVEFPDLPGCVTGGDDIDRTGRWENSTGSNKN